ncbi:unnamed protein product [Miscanthus lutarioriparius]|uniref:DUF1995 domain-containing protein n=1 Tax=Miscanthus lutarioriparius TaxID=422564 RepID=A0A811PY05_9POAL|nr:unnamed protein product [Miscanthus lutarioriparius]
MVPTTATGEHTASNWIPATISNGTGGMFTVASRNSRNGFQVRAVTGDPGSRNVSDVKFPTDYTELLMQAKEAAESAFKDGKKLLEIEFPTAGLQTGARFEFVTFCVPTPSDSEHKLV